MRFKFKLKISKGNGGLRRKFFITVVLPTVLPLVVLGFLGYQRMNDLTKASLANQQGDSAATTAAKLDREVSIRQTILQKTTEEVFGVNREFSDKKANLTTKHNDCLIKINRLPDSTSRELQESQANGQSQDIEFDAVISSESCDYALPEFAKLQDLLLNSEARIRTSYKTAANKAYDQQTSQLDVDKTQKMTDRLRAYLVFFPETASLKVFTGDKILAETGEGNLIDSSRQNQYLNEKNATFVSLAFTAQSNRYLAMKYALSDGTGLAVFDLDHALFLKPSWESAPRVNQEDKVYIVDSSGTSLYPNEQLDSETKDLFGRIANAKVRDSDDRAHNFSLGDEAMIGRSTTIKGPAWAVITASPEKLLIEPLKAAQRLSAGAVLIAIATALILGLVFLIPATRTINKLSQAAKKFANRDFKHRIDAKNHDELGDLANTMNQMATEIEAAEKALDEKNKEFINVATHEIKAPMTAIIGNLSMVIEDGVGKVDEKAKPLISSAFEQTERLRDLVVDMLDVARLEGKREQFDLKTLDLTSEIQKVIDTQKVPAGQNNVELKFERSEVQPKVKADAVKLQIVLTNFISNAIKYNRPGGSVTITQFSKDGYITVTITDTGLGIPEDQKDKVFAKFFRVQHADRKNISGTGLGMYITKQYIETMGGKVWFESTLGKGTTFYFTLPSA